jgi:hypothetical protein
VVSDQVSTSVTGAAQWQGGSSARVSILEKNVGGAELLFMGNRGVGGDARSSSRFCDEIVSIRGGEHRFNFNYVRERFSYFGCMREEEDSAPLGWPLVQSANAGFNRVREVGSGSNVVRPGQGGASRLGETGLPPGKLALGSGLGRRARRWQVKHAGPRWAPGGGQREKDLGSLRGWSPRRFRDLEILFLFLILSQIQN